MQKIHKRETNKTPLTIWTLQESESCGYPLVAITVTEQTK